MVRRKRMGAHNALDELLPGPPLARPGAEWAAHPVPGPAKRTSRPKRMGLYNALDDLLPGPGAGPEADPGPALLDWSGTGWGSPTRPASSDRGGTRRAAVYDALDDLLPGPPAPPARPARVRASFSLPPEVLDAVRDAAAHLSSGPGRMTLAELAEQALRAEVERLAAAHNRGRPFPHRPPR